MTNVAVSGALGLLVSSTTASFSSIAKILNQLQRDNATAVNPALRSLPGQTADFTDYLKPYGCWCNFDDANADKSIIHYGRGEPIDEWDALCKQLQEGYECAILDAKARGETCQPWTYEALEDFEAGKSAYKLTTGNNPSALFGSDPTKNREQGITDALWICEAGQIDDVCAQQTCIAEYFYIMSVWTLLYEQGVTYGQRRNNIALVENAMTPDAFLADGFDRELNCPAKGVGNPNVNKACCGNWPRRFAYKTVTPEGNPRECCVASEIAEDFMNQQHEVGQGKVFDTLIHKCCADGSVGAIGQDC